MSVFEEKGKGNKKLQQANEGSYVNKNKGIASKI